MSKFLAYNCIENEYEEFDNIEDARKWLESKFLCKDEGYHPDLESCKIYSLKEIVSYDVVDSKENYKYVYEDDIPENDTESEAWPYNTDFDEIWKHKFIDVTESNCNCNDLELYNGPYKVCRDCGKLHSAYKK